MNSFHADQRDALNRSLTEVQGQVSVSFEFLPPCTSEMEQTLQNSIDRPNSLRPRFVSAIYGVNSGERDRAHSIIKGVKDRTGLEAASCLIRINATLAELRIIACDYWNGGTRHIVMLRGDLPPGSDKPEMYTSDLVALLKEMTDLGTSMVTYPEVYPEVKSVQADLLNLRRKVDAEANRAITQFLFDIESHPCFRDRCVSVGIDVEIILGTLPVLSFKQTKELADMTNMRIPVRMVQVSDGLDDDAETRKLVSANTAMDMVEILSCEGVKDFHFYMLNRVEMSYAICHTLGVRPGLQIVYLL